MPQRSPKSGYPLHTSHSNWAVSFTRFLLLVHIESVAYRREGPSHHFSCYFLKWKSSLQVHKSNRVASQRYPWPPFMTEETKRKQMSSVHWSRYLCSKAVITSESAWHLSGLIQVFFHAWTKTRLFQRVCVCLLIFIHMYLFRCKHVSVFSGACCTTPGLWVKPSRTVPVKMRNAPCFYPPLFLHSFSFTLQKGSLLHFTSYKIHPPPLCCRMPALNRKLFPADMGVNLAHNREKVHFSSG